MLDHVDNPPWMQEKKHFRTIFRTVIWDKKSTGLKDLIRTIFVNTKYFQIVGTTRKRQNVIWNIMDEHEILSEEQNLVLQVFSNEFSIRFKRGPKCSFSLGDSSV